MSAPDLHTTHAIPPPHADPAREPATVLLVEDDRAIRRYLQVILERSGFRVVAAADGLEAMKVALSERVAAVVTDAIMPHLGGHELCRFLRRHPKLKGLPVVLLSGSEPSAPPADPSERADRYLTKPVRPEVLTGCIAALLEGRA
jgi:CheY-like chemotaxis protein